MPFLVVIWRVKCFENTLRVIRGKGIYFAFYIFKDEYNTPLILLLLLENSFNFLDDMT